MENVLVFADAVLFNSTGLFFVALGALVSLRFTGYPDLTIDGSFTFGAALYALSVANGAPIMLALVAAMIGGSFGGVMTGTLNQYLKIGQIISGIIVMIFLILIIPYFSGNATVGLLTQENIFTYVGELNRTFTNALITNAHFSLHTLFSALLVTLLAIVSFFLYIFFKSKHGVAIRYSGSAEEPNLIPQSKRAILIIVGLAVGNALVALGGAIEAERNGGFSQNMGIGMILIAIATLVLGESIWKAIKKRRNLYLHQQIGAALTGVLVYATGVQFILSLSVSFVDIRLVTTLVVLVLLAYVSSVQSNIRELF